MKTMLIFDCVGEYLRYENELCRPRHVAGAGRVLQSINKES